MFHDRLEKDKIEELAKKIYIEFAKLELAFLNLTRTYLNHTQRAELLIPLAKILIEHNCDTSDDEIREMVKNFFKYFPGEKTIQNFAQYGITYYKKKILEEKRRYKNLVKFLERIIQEKGVDYIIENLDLFPKQYRKLIEEKLLKEEIKDEGY